MEKMEVRKSLGRVKFGWNVFDSTVGQTPLLTKSSTFVYPFMMFCHSATPSSFFSRGPFLKLLCPGYMGASLSAGRAG